MKGKSLSLLLGFVMGTALAGTAQKQPVRRYFKASNPSLTQQGLPVPYSDAVLVGDTMYVAGRTGIDPKSGAIPQDVEWEIRFLLDSFKSSQRRNDNGRCGYGSGALSGPFPVQQI